MPAMIRDIVDLPNVATAADGTNQLVGVCALFAGQTLWTRLWLIEENEDNVVAVVIDLETFSMENYTKVE